MANFDQQNQNVSKQVNISKADKVYLSEEPPPRKPSFTAPPPPPHFVNRLAEFEAVVEMLLAQQTVETHSRRVALTTAIQGGGGFGKTTLAMAVCHDERVKQHFSDGIVWLSVGQTPNRVALLNDLFKLFETKPPSFSDINLAAAHWRDLVRERRILLVLDDVWSDLKARSFLPDSPPCTTLLTTRLQEVVNRTQAQTLTVNEMSTEQAARLLVNWLSEEPEPADWQLLEDLARLLGEWPLMLELVAPTLRAQVMDYGKSLNEAITHIRRRLERKGFTYFDRTDEQARNRAISISIEVSLEQLNHRFAAGRTRYLELAIFPEDTDIPCQTVYQLWQATAELDDLDTEDALAAMHNLNLFVQYDPQQQTFRLHDVMRHYLLGEHTAANLRNLHATFLTAYRAVLTHWAELSPDELYLWDHLAYHLLAAQQAEELLTTVKDLRYLAAKSYVRTPYAAEADLRLAQQHAEDDRELEALSQRFAPLIDNLLDLETVETIRLKLYNSLQHINNLQFLAEQWLTQFEKPCIVARLSLPARELPPSHLIRTFVGHTNKITACAYSPNGETIISSSDDNTLKLWDVETGECIRTFSGHEGRVIACAYSPDGKTVLSGSSDDNTLKLWNVETGECICTFSGHEGRVIACAYSPDGTIVFVSRDVLDLRGFKGWVDGREVYGGVKIILKLWNVETGESRIFTGNLSSVTACAYSPDGDTIVFGSRGNTLELWDVGTGECIRTFSGHEGRVTTSAYSPVGETMISGSRDKTLKLWDVRTGECVRTFTQYTGFVTACAYSPNGRTIVSGSSGDSTLKLWDMMTGEECIRTFEGHMHWVTACAYSPNGRTIVSSSWDKTLKLWDVTTGVCIHTFMRHIGIINSCAYSPDGGTIVSASRDKTLKLWGVETGECIRIFTGHESRVTACAYSPDGETIVSASRDKTLKLWDVDTGEELHTLTGHTEQVDDCIFSPDGQFILSASSDKTVKLWQTQTGQIIHTLIGHTNKVVACAYSPDGQTILSASMDKTLKLWAVETGDCIRTFAGHTRDVTACAYSPDGQTILSASADHTLKLWAVETGECLATLAVEDWLADCAWSPNGRDVVAVGQNGVYFLQVRF